MTQLATTRKEAIRLLLKSILAASIEAARGMERHILNAGVTGKQREDRMNAVCAELLAYHLWRACRTARIVLPPDAYPAFAATAANGLAVAAAGIFTGLYDQAAQKKFLADLKTTFARYDRCTPEILPCRDPLTSTCPLGALSRTLASVAGWPSNDGVTYQAFALAEQSLLSAKTDDHVHTIARAA